MMINVLARGIGTNTGERGNQQRTNIAQEMEPRAGGRHSSTTGKAQKIAPDRASTMTAIGDLWALLPPELLRAIMEGSPSCPLHAYIQLLSLSHSTRTRIRGTLRNLSFVEPDPILPSIIRPTTDAVAALVGPCKNLSQLSIPESIDPCGDVNHQFVWVDEAFEGHAQLAVLTHFPTHSEAVIERILSHLPGLVELTVQRNLYMSTRLLAALARSCPGLQVLRCFASSKSSSDPVRLASNRLQELNISGDGPASGLALRCPALVKLAVERCRVDSLQCPRLLTVSLPVQPLEAEDTLPNLERVEPSCGAAPSVGPAWLLTGSPRLQVLSGGYVTRLDLLAKLGACGTLISLQYLYLDVKRLPNPLALRLPEQLERLDLHLESRSRHIRPMFDLQVEAPWLLDFKLSIAEEMPFDQVHVRLNCPSLLRLGLKSEIPVSLQIVDEAVEGTRRATQPLNLDVDGLEVSSLLDLLTRHGARLRVLRAQNLQMVEDWPQLMGALSGLPRLRDLELEGQGGAGLSPAGAALWHPALEVASEACSARSQPGASAI
ncbi:hypothetical protein PAPYR_9536 [Paratrimastix pyriformis]|uniref:Uncharacterized protein n=1 Tax=Paratrimastix pyriformis TaxID=342808 RepID=A0ABQ8UCW8_9EUKA|nr:hypothetical protein PAPYR_9536 [Paratrimastix pyriformis]